MHGVTEGNFNFYYWWDFYFIAFLKFSFSLWKSSRWNKCEVNGAEMCSIGDETVKLNYFVLGLGCRQFSLIY